MVAFVGEIELVVELHVLTRDDGADAADASGLHGRLGAGDLERAGVGAGAQQGNYGSGRSHQAGGRSKVAHGRYGLRGRWKSPKNPGEAMACSTLETSLREKASCRSERVADADIHTSRPGVGDTCRAADQANAGAILVVDTRNPGVHRSALGEVVDISD
ncbi:hypothetical protein SDC9_141509 [bioreactor metagenome]|uniref:Uncharacterized protein n=1 Tax=bioreactor metagenome TaxID=1076179 RepID=A0A645E0I2_9ZZZZ